MTEDLRIRDARGSREEPGRDREPQIVEQKSSRDEAPGETAWDLAEPLSDSPPLSRQRKSGAQEPEDNPIPFPMFPGMGGEEEESPNAPGLDIQRLVLGVRKRLWLAVGIAFAIAVLFLVGAVTLIKAKWEAVAVVMVHTRQDEFSLGGAKPFESQDYTLRTMLDTIKLPSALLEISDALELNATPRALGPAIGVRTGKDSNLFQIAAVWKDPVVAANLANKVADQLVQRSRDLRHKDAEGAHANYTAQLEAARRELRTVTERMRAFKTTHQVSDFNAETQVLLDSLIRLEAELNTKIAETEAMGEALTDIDAAIQGEPEMVVTSTVYRNPLKTRLADYEWQLQEARSRYTEQNPKVIKLQTRVDVLNKMIDESKDEGAPENLYSANTKLVALEGQQRELKNDIRIREAQIAALSQTVKQSRAKLAALVNAERDFQLLQQRLTSAGNLESNLVGRVEEARVVMLRNEAAFELFEAASPPTEPAPSPKRLIAIAGVVLGGMTGLFVALLLELLDPLVRTRRDVLAIPGVPLGWEFQQVPEGHHTLVDAAEPGDPVAILFRRLINDLDAQRDSSDWQCIGVTSAEPEVGRTLVATNLSHTLAIKEHPVILVDADLRGVAGMRPADLFGFPPDRPGLRQALRGLSPIAPLLYATETPDLSLLTDGCFQPNHSPEALAVGEPSGAALSTVAARPANASSVPELDGRPPDLDLVRLGSRQFRTILDALRQSGRHLVFDLPPVSTHETVLEAAACLGNIVLVAHSGKTTRAELREVAQLLENRGAKICAILVTGVPDDSLEGASLFPTDRKRRKRWWWFRRSPSAAVSNADTIAPIPSSQQNSAREPDANS